MVQPPKVEKLSAATDSTDVAPAAATVSTPLVDWGIPLPQYPDVAGFTKTEVAAVAFVALASATVATLPVNPLLAIPLALMTLTAFGRFVQLGTNTAPVVQTTSQTVPLPVVGTVTGQVVGYDADGDPLTYTATQGTQGAVVMNPLDGSYVYQPYSLGLAGVQDSFTVTIDDSLGIRDHPLGTHTTTTVIDISIPGITVNGVPTFDVQPTVTGTDTQTGLVSGQFKAHDPEGDPLTFTTVGALFGSVNYSSTPNSDGYYTFSYTPDDPHAASLIGQTLGLSDAFTIIAKDQAGNLSLPSSPVTITLATSVNTPPHATFENTGGSTLLGTVTGKVTATDAEDSLFAFTLPDATSPLLPLTTSKGGLVSVNPITGDYVYTAALAARQAASALGASADDKSDQFTVKVDDLHGGTTTVDVTVAIPTINLAPLGGTPSNLVPDSNGVVRGSITNVINLDGDPLTYSLSGNTDTAYTSNGGIVHVDAAGNYVYVPKVNQTTVLGVTADVPYIDSFDVVVADNHGGTTTVTVPVLTSLKVTTSTTNPATGEVAVSIGVNAANAGLFTYGVGSGATKGTVSVNGSTLTYTTSLTGHGTDPTDSFTVTGTAFGKTISVATVTVNPSLSNTPPTVAQSITNTSVSGAVLGSYAAVVATITGKLTPSDADGDTAFSYTLQGGLLNVGLSAKGATVTLNNDGTYTYSTATAPTLVHSAANGGTTDTFTVAVADGFGGTTNVTVNVPIPGGYNAAPSIPGGIAPLTKFKTATWTLVIPTDADLDGLSWSYTANNGTVSWNLTTGTLIYTSNGGGTFSKGPNDTIVVTVNDGHGGVTSKTFTY